MALDTYSTPFTPLLVGLYFLLVILAIYQIILIHSHGHKLLSFNYGFLWLCVLFCMFRVTFWLVETRHYFTYHLAFWYPINIQFGMFYLVMLYIRRLVERSESTSDMRGFQKKVVKWVSLILNMVFFWATTVWLIFCSTMPSGDKSGINTCESTHAIFAAMCFLTLGLSLLFYGVKLHIIASREAAAREKDIVPATKVNWGPNETRFRTEAICFLLLSVFISRAVFDLVQLDIFNSHPLAVSSGDYNKDITNAAVFWMYVVWEIFPTTLMLFFFGTAASAATAVSASQQALMQERLTITDPMCDSTVNGKSDLEDDGELIESGQGTNAYWPFSKEVADAVGQAQHQRSIRANDADQGLLNDPNRYDSPVLNDIYGPLPPLTSQTSSLQGNLQARGYAAAMAQAPYRQANILASQASTAAYHSQGNS